MKNELLKLAIVQYDPKWEDAQNNLNYLSNLLVDLKLDSDLVILPEAFSTGFSMNAEKIAEPMDGYTVQWMIKNAVEKKLALCGSVFIKENNKFFNRFVWVHPDGKIETYDKRHLFSMGGETAHYNRGETAIVINYKGWKIFPQICYDLRFPVWSRNTYNYDLLINVANWPAVRKNVWDILLKARAIENQCYVVAVNRIGTDAIPINYSGDSQLIDFKGNVLLNSNDVEGVFYEQIELSELKRFRNKFDSLKDADQFEIK